VKAKFKIAGSGVLLLLLTSLLRGGEAASHRSFSAAVEQNAAHTAPPPSDIDVDSKDPKPYPFKFVVFGDMRFAEQDSYFGKHIANGVARQSVVQDVVRADPAFVFMTGDLVFRGFHAEDWKSFEEGMSALRKTNVPIFPALGNHEVGPFPAWASGISFSRGSTLERAGLANYHKEFPEIPGTRGWYSVRYANCYFLVLNSTRDDSRSSPQREWMNRQLDSIPGDTDYVFVILHHPPHTAAPDALHRVRPQEKDLATALEEKQKMMHARIIVIAGHVHNYERYEFNRVQYIVSGGGGAEPHKFTRSVDDLYAKQDPLIQDQFHYCLITVNHSKLKFEMMRLNEKGKFERKDHFELDTSRDAVKP
jgi:hypothetical protein